MRSIALILCLSMGITLNGQLVSEDFEVNDGGWTESSSSGNPYWEWGAPAGTLINDDNGGGGNAWVTGLNGDFTIAEFEVVFLTSQAYDLSSLTEGSLSFGLNLDLGVFNDGFDDYYDGAVIEYSIDGFDWWTIGDGSAGTNWYDEFEGFWIGNTGGWVTATHDLPAEVIGESSVQFRFVFFSNAPAGTYGYEGLAFDDFQILETSTGGGGGGGGGGSGGGGGGGALVAGTTQIKSVSLTNELFPAVVDSTSSTVTMFVAPGTDVTTLAPTLTLSDGATVSPISGSTQDFSTAVTYTVTSADAMENTDWTVSAVVPDIDLLVTPMSGIAGTVVNIYGRGFSTVANENSVTIGGMTVPVLSASATRLTLEIPTDLPYGLHEVLTSSNGLVSKSGTFFNVLATGVSGVFDDYKETDFNLNASSIVNAMAVGDIDGDGDLDFVYDNETILNISTLENGGIQSTVNKVTDRASGATSFNDITIVDVDGDNLPDIVTGGIRLGWFKNNGDGTWGDEVIIDDASSSYSIEVFDIDGDFDQDIISDEDFALYSYTNTGSGFALNYKSTPSQLGRPVDWDGDGDMDMVTVGTSADQIELATNDGTGNFTDVLLTTTGVTNIDFVQIGDLDNDGDLDLVYSTADQGITVSTVGYKLNNGDDTFAAEVAVLTEGIFDTKRIELGDLNNDGYLDIARTKDDGVDGVFDIYMTSDILNYSISQTLDNDAGGLDLVLVDIEQDGDLDLLQEASQSGGYFPLFLKYLEDADIVEFSFAELTGAATINATNKTVTVEVGASADITALTPTIAVSPSAGITPASGVAQDFSAPFTYDVAPEDGTIASTTWTVTVHQVPAVPALAVEPASVDQTLADVTWTVGNDGATSFELEVSELEDFSTLVSGLDPLVITDGADRSGSLTGLNAGTTYYARIRGLNDVGTYSDYSTSVSFLTISATPVALVATEVRSDSFIANWETANGADEYSLEVSTDDFTSTIFSATTTETTLDVTGLSQGTTYKYRVQSSNTTGSSVYSNIITLTTNIVPQSLSLDNQSVSENQALGTVVGALSTVDNDDTIHTYELVAGTGDTDNALFAIDGTNLVTNESFNFEGQDQYSVRIRSTDPKDASVASSFLIDILNTNDTPSGITLVTSAYSPTGYDPVATGVGIFSTSDEDAGDDNSNITLELISGGDSFEIAANPNDGTETTFLITKVVFTNEVDQVVPITVQATDDQGASVTQDFDITINAFVDTEAPVMTPSPQNSNTFLAGGPDRTLSVTVTDFRINQVSFFSRLLTEPEFTSEVITGTNEEYSVTIQETDLGVAGIEYYFEGLDEAGNKGFTSLNTLSLAFDEDGDNAPKVESVTKFGRSVDSYQIISIPFAFSNPTDKRVDAIFNEFSDDVINREYRIIKWDPTAVNPDTEELGKLVDLSPSSTIELGEAYFFISSKERSITIERANINLQDPFALELKQGWNLVGNPYNIDLSWTSVLDNNGATGIVGALRVLDPENPETWPESTILKQLEGAFVFSSQDITLNLSYTDASITFGGGRVAEQKAPDWFLPISLEQNGDIRNGGIGMDRMAASNLDSYDEPVLPKWLEFLEIAFLKDETEQFNRLNKDVVPVTDSKVWEFEVSSSSNGSSTLNWDEGYAQVTNLQLLDVETGVIIDMTQQSSYTFDLQGPRSFKILYSTDPMETFQFDDLHVLDAYPNPFTDAFKVPVRLPKANTQYSVQVNLLDLSGRVIHEGQSVATRAGSLEYLMKKPDHVFPGVYMYKVIIENQSVETSYTKKIIIQ